MAVKIEFDSNNQPLQPTLVLAERNGHKIGVIYNIDDFKFVDNLNDKTVFEFSINKTQNGTVNQYWDMIDNFKLVWIAEYDLWFEITIRINENDSTIKSVTGESICETELSQIYLFNIEINTQADIEREDYTIPTVLYNPSEPSASLLHRLMGKIPHYSIEHIDSSLANIQRTFSFDNITIYDAFQEIAEELQCIFIFNSGTDSNGKIARSISVYDLCDVCSDCGYRGTIAGVCPKCNSTNIVEGYGINSMVYVDSEYLGEDIELAVDTGAYKNCFKLEAGDDLMTATVVNCSPNGSNYLWRLDDVIRSDMSDELKSKLVEYDTAYSSFDGYSVDLYANYNEVLTEYQAIDSNLTMPLMVSQITSFAELMEYYYNTIDFEHYLKSECMPTESLENPTTLNEQLSIVNGLSGEYDVGVMSQLNTMSQTTATSYVLAMVRTYINQAYYEITIYGTPIYNTATHTWSGRFTITNLTDDSETGRTNTISLTLTNSYNVYVLQRINALLKNEDETKGDYLIDLFTSSNRVFCNKLKLHCLDNLNNYQQICQSVLNVLITYGAGDGSQNFYSIYDDSDDANEIYQDYLEKMDAINEEIFKRENDDLFIVRKIQSDLLRQKTIKQNSLDIERFLGATLWQELCSYRREQVYNNSNFISDGLENDELFERALEFIDLAKEELYKASTYQYSITASLKNLLAMQEFRSIIDNFSVGSWLHLKVNDNLYKLRLISYTIDYSKFNDIEVEFSDVLQVRKDKTDIASILNQASSLASSYDTVLYQAVKTKTNTQFIEDWVNKGLDATNVMITNNMENQEVIFDKHGILCRQYSDITNGYSPEQVKIIHKGLYYTNNNWQSVKTGIGNFIYYDPATGEYKNGYGVIADTIVANIILGSKVGIYNKNNSITLNQSGLTITANGTNGNKDLLCIQNDDGNGTIKKLLYMNSSGKLFIDGSDVKISVSAASDIISNVNSTTDSKISSYDATLQITLDGITTSVTDVQDDVDSLAEELSDWENYTTTLNTRVTNISTLAVNSDNITARVARVINGLVDNNGDALSKTDATTVSLTATAVKYAWDNISDYVSIENGGLYIKTGSAANATNLVVLNGSGLTINNGAITVKDYNNNNVFYTDATSHKTVFAGEMFIRLLRNGQSTLSSTLANRDGAIQCNSNGLSYQEYQDGYWYETIGFKTTGSGGTIKFWSLDNDEYNYVGRIRGAYWSQDATAEQNPGSNPSYLGWGYDLEIQAETNNNSSYGAVRIIGSNAAIRVGYGELLYYGSLLSTSDKRLKKNIIQLDDINTISVLNKLNPVKFNFIADERNIQHYGLIAQELLEVLQEHNIDTSKSALVSCSNNKYYSIGYTELIPLLIKAIQYQQKQIEQLQEER